MLVLITILKLLYLKKLGLSGHVGPERCMEQKRKSKTTSTN